MKKAVGAAVDAYSGVDNLEVMADATNYNRFLHQLIANNLPKQGCVLDFGAGIGTFEEQLKSEGYEVECLEVDDALKFRLSARGYKVWGDAKDLPLGRFAAIFSLNVLEHIDGDAAAITALKPALASEGRLLIYVPAFPLLFGSMDRKVGHFRRYRKQSTVKMFTGAGYTVNMARYVDTVGFFAALAFRLVGNAKGDLSPRSVRLFDRWLFPLNRLLDPLFGRWFGKNLLILARKNDA